MEHTERFNRIYDETRDDLLRYLMLRTSAAPEAEDLFQEVYQRFYRRMTRGALPILDAKRYLFAIAKKVLAQYYREAAERKEAEQPILTDDPLAQNDEPIDERLLKQEQKDVIWTLLQREPELNRRCFVLFYGYERSQKEIGEALGIGEQAVRQRLYRTRERIKRLLESECDGQERSNK